MKIIEARDGFIKFETAKQISLTSFIKILGDAKSYIAQIVQIKRAGELQIAYAKLLFLYDGTLLPYDKTLPSNNSEIEECTFDIINKSIATTNPIVVGKFIDNNIDILIDHNCFNKNFLICSDNPKNLSNVISNLEKQFVNQENVLIVDMLGNLNLPKHIAGKDFKLPLNTESLAFMYEDCLNDATTDSKSLIKEIFQDLAEYSKTVPFLPFSTLKTIVDDMVNKSHIFKLLVLKNKLTKFDEQGIFAGTIDEAENLENILSQKIARIDLSKLDTVFQNRFLEVIYSIIEDKKLNTQVLVNASNAINKKNLKNIIQNKTISNIFVTHSRFKYINEIKSMFDNFIIEPSFANNEIFKIYYTFLNSMPKDTCLIVGEGTNYIPFVFSTQQLSEQDFEKYLLKNSKNIETSDFENTQENDNFIDNIIEENTEELEIDNSINYQETNDINEIEPIEIIDKKNEEIMDKITEEVSINNEEIQNVFELNSDDIDDEEDVTEEDFTNNDFENASTIEEESINEFIEDFTVIEDNNQNVEDSTSENELISEDIENPNLLEDTLQENVDINLNNIQNDIIELSDEDEDTEVLNLSTENIEFNSDIDNIEPEIIELTEDTDVLEIEDTTNTLNENYLIEEDPEELSMEVLSLDNSDDNLEEVAFEELDPVDTYEDDIVVEIDEIEPLSNSEEDLDREIVKDVDKVFTTMREDVISDTDLDVIDELNDETALETFSSNMELENEFDNNSEDVDIIELPEYAPDEEADDSFLEPLNEINDVNKFNTKEPLETRKTTTPIVPVYDAEIPQEDIVSSDIIDQGDLVTHATYGHGVVEKMIKYGSKTLYSINFDNLGRKLLDPTLTEIKKA